MSMRTVIGMILMTLAATTASAANATTRPVVDMDGTWAFRPDPANEGEAQQWYNPGVAFPREIQVPGAWEAQGVGDETDKLRHHFLGKGWYRREITIPAEWAGQHIYLCITGVHRYASVWVNGQALGEHIGYLSPFEFDLTAIAQPGAPVCIAIRVDSVQRWEVDTMIGAMDLIDYMDTYWGGISGHVRLEARAAAYFQDLYVAPEVNPARCQISAKLTGAVPDGAVAHAALIDKTGTIVAETDAESVSAAVVLEAPNATLWMPDTPELYTARLSLVVNGKPVDTVETRFGFRRFTTEGSHLLLNGKRFFLRGYGDDSIYPETMMPYASKAKYLERLSVAKAYGFNHVRHHSHMMPPEYFDACDEIGMLVSAEFPIAYQPFYDRAQPAALDHYRSEWTAAITKLRNHPSILDWCMGNEMYKSVPIAPALYRIAKELDPTRPVMDSDGIPTNGFIQGTEDRDTLDLYAIQFNVWDTPLDVPDMYACPSPKKPVISHENGNFVTFPRMDLIDAFQDNFKPFWLTEARDKVAKMGLLNETEQWALNSGRLYTLLHKINIETLRKSPNISGYHWWLLQDYWTTSNGIVDHYFRFKPGIDQQNILQFNEATVLLQDGIDLVYRSGETMQAKFLVSNFSAGDFETPVLSYRICQEGKGIDPSVYTSRLVERRCTAESILLEHQETVKTAPQGELTDLWAFDAPMPDVAEPTRVRIRAELQTKTLLIANDWFTWVYPAKAALTARDVTCYATPELMIWLAPFGVQPIPAQEPLSAKAVYICSQPTNAIIDAVKAGASLLLHRSAGVLPASGTRFKTAWWKGAPDDNNAGTVVYEHPVTRGMAPEGWCDTAWRRLLEQSDGYILDEIPEPPSVLIRGIEVAAVCRNKGMLLEGRLGEGCVLMSGLNLDATLPDGSPCPEAAWLTARLIDYAVTFPKSAAAFPEKALREAAEVLPVEGPLVNGFTRLLRNDGEESRWFTYRETSGIVKVLRQQTKGALIEWETAPAPADITQGAAFIFAGGIGWISQPATAGFTLVINGKDTVRFDVSKGRQSWRDEASGVTLSFLPRRATNEDQAGLFYVSLPPAQLTPDQPCQIAVRSDGEGSQRWFSLHPYTNVAPR